MANLTTTIKSILNGTKVPVPTTAEMKSALGTLYDFLTDLLGTDSAAKDAARTALGTPTMGGLRNVIINGDFRFNQRGYVGGTATGTANQYTLDRWRINTAGQSISWSNDGTGFLVTAPAGGLEQLVEGRQIIGGTYGINWDGSASCQVNGQAVTKGGTIALTANTQVSVKFFSGTVTRVRLEPGTAMAWEPRPAAVELVMCMYYYERSYTALSGIYEPASGGLLTIRLKRPKRIVPTVTITNAVAVSTTVNATYTTTTQFTLTSTASISAVASFNYAADAELT